MENFSYHNTTKIIFGRNTEKLTGTEVACRAKKILLHYGGGSIKKTGLYETVVRSLREAGIEFIELPGVKSNPRLSLVNEGIDMCKKNNIELVLAIGGGSVIDSAKAIGMGSVYKGNVWDFFTGKAEPGGALPIATVLTIPAAGSEASSGCVITKEEGLLKRAVDSEFIYPQFSILNPELAYTLPENQITNGITDILSHLMERYFTNVKNVEITDRLIEGTMKTIINNAQIVLEDRKNYDAWSEIMWSGTIAHNNLLNTGRIGDWASHDIEHELSGIYDIAHGAGLSIVIPAWMRYVYINDIGRFAQFAHKIWNIDYSFENPEKTAKNGIKRLEQFFKEINQPTRLSEINITDDRLEEMAFKCTDLDTHTVGNFVKLHSKDVYKILCLAR